MRRAAIVSPLRTPVGKFLGTLAPLNAGELGAVILKALVARTGLDPAKVNVHGGAIALGHPIGASGARVLTTLVHSLQATGRRYGAASLCIGGGMGTAMVIERI